MCDRDRYQEQRWYVKLWRRRWYLLIPWDAWRWRGCKEIIHPWHLAVGVAQGKMEWYYTMEEVFGKRENW